MKCHSELVETHGNNALPYITVASAVVVQRWSRYAICSNHLASWQHGGDQFLSRIIAIDEFWDRTYEPELKHQSTEWQHAGSPRSQKVRQNPSPVKLMVIVKCDVKGVIVCHFFPHGRTVTTQYYRDFLVRQIPHGVRDKLPDLVNNEIFLHDNTKPHNTECI
ncbi:mariner transposase [Trichonephila clavata]|uniref:Mariner transposase n=1 Tax=Trichonephila clavata TaxID=2740835 RepID=A0A8X6FSH0_TRICU|nr:mariner transposase [Trichonephila clavata]